MTVYIDTSVLVAALTREGATDRAQNWLARQAPGTLAISHWTRLEFASALRFKQATGQIDPGSRAAAAAHFATLCADSLVVWPAELDDFDEGARFAAADALALRGPDALHFAIAWRRGATLCTLDDGLQRACAAFGLPVVMP